MPTPTKADLLALAERVEGEGIRALSVRAPWWFAILRMGKDIENRDWRGSSYRGWALLHSSSWWKEDELEMDWDDAKDMAAAAGRPWTSDGTKWRDIRAAGGSIVGLMHLGEPVRASTSPWFVGPLGLTITETITLPEPVKCKGALSFFMPEPEVLFKVGACLRARALLTEREG